MAWNFERELEKIDSEIEKIKPLDEKRADAVIEVGGVKGIGLAGALYTAEKLVFSDRMLPPLRWDLLSLHWSQQATKPMILGKFCKIRI